MSAENFIPPPAHDPAPWCDPRNPSKGLTRHACTKSGSRWDQSTEDNRTCLDRCCRRSTYPFSSFRECSRVQYEEEQLKLYFSWKSTFIQEKYGKRKNIRRERRTIAHSINMDTYGYLVFRGDTSKEVSFRNRETNSDCREIRELWSQLRRIGEVFPHVRWAVLLIALIVEAIDLRDLPGFVVPAQDRDTIAKAHFV